MAFGLADVDFETLEGFRVGEITRDDDAKVTTLKKKQRSIVQAGIHEVATKQRAQSERVQRTTARMDVSSAIMMICIAPLATLANTWPNTVAYDVGQNVKDGIGDDIINGTIGTLEKHEPSLVVSYLGTGNDLGGDQMDKCMGTLDDFAESGTTVLHIDTQWDRRLATIRDVVVHLRGHLSSTCNTDGVRALVSDWTWNRNRHHAPRSADDLQTESFAARLKSAHCEAEPDWIARAEFPAVYAEEQQQEAPMDMLDELDDDDGEAPLPEGADGALLKDEEMLDEMPLPGDPGHENNRREKWLEVPGRARAAIGNMHSEWGRTSKSVLRKIQKTAKAPQEYIDAADHHQCNDCFFDAPKT
ncbi:hypothetical protein N9L19_01250 [bacterium]|nr:hypothetical protein [bacterium]